MEGWQALWEFLLRRPETRSESTFPRPCICPRGSKCSESGSQELRGEVPLFRGRFSGCPRGVPCSQGAPEALRATIGAQVPGAMPRDHGSEGLGFTLSDSRRAGGALRRGPRGGRFR